jgi:hypothetical protein
MKIEDLNPQESKLLGMLLAHSTGKLQYVIQEMDKDSSLKESRTAQIVKLALNLKK